ncbi:MAG: MATE family efflux transporter [Streptomyces sp.]|nr:MATE family efflux transporter [Streptomyces sp.]
MSEATHEESKQGPGESRTPQWTAIGRLAGPMALVEVVDFLVLLGIVALMGRMEGDALYVRSLYQPVGGAVIAVTAGFVISNQVAASISRGRNRPQDVMAVAAGMARVWAAAGGVVILALVVSAPELADLFGVPGPVRGSFVAFLRWTLAAELLVIASLLCASSLRGYGRIRSATVITLTVAVVRIACVAGLGLGTGLGMWSVPVGAASAGLIGLVLGLALLRRTELWHPHALRTWNPQVRSLLTGVGLPVTATMLLVAGYGAAMLWALSGFGPEVVAGYSVASALQNLVMLPGLALGAATAVVINQRRGAGSLDTLEPVVRTGLWMSAGLYVVLGGLTWLIREPVAEWITGSPDIGVEASRYLGTVALTYAVQGPVLTALTLMEQIGGGYLAIALNTVYFTLIVVAGKLAVEAGGAPQDLYDTVAVCNFLGVSVVVVAVRYAARVRRAASAP